MTSPASPIVNLYDNPMASGHTYGFQVVEVEEQTVVHDATTTLVFWCATSCDSIAVNDGSGIYTYYKVDPQLFEFSMTIEFVGTTMQPLPPITIKGSNVAQSGIAGSQTASLSPTVISLTYVQADSSVTEVEAVPPYTEAYNISSKREEYTSCTIYPQGPGKGTEEPITIPLNTGFQILLEWVG